MNRPLSLTLIDLKTMFFTLSEWRDAHLPEEKHDPVEKLVRGKILTALDTLQPESLDAGELSKEIQTEIAELLYLLIMTCGDLIRKMQKENIGPPPPEVLSKQDAIQLSRDTFALVRALQKGEYHASQI